ncbi:hypothetical protein ACWGE0_25065 [Lentzea sp. NPDC054927]
MQSGVWTSEISKDLPEPRQRLAQALRDLFDCIPNQNGKRLSHARFLRGMGAGRVGPSSFSRYFKGDNVPSARFTRDFHTRIGGYTSTTLPLTCEELIILHKEAEATDKRLRETQNKVAEASARKIEKLKQQVLELMAAKAETAALPVPRTAGDRQGTEFAGHPAPQAAIEAIELTTRGRHEQALTLLSQLSMHLDAREVALCLAHFRAQQHDELADTLMQIYGRDNEKSHVVRLAIALRDCELPADADAMLLMII